MKIWANIPDELRSFHREGLDLIATLPPQEHLAVQWCMTMSVYPFWAGVSNHVGRLLRLQGTVVANQVQRRLREQYGDRETVSRRVRYVLRSFVDWEVLRETAEKGIYSTGDVLPIHNVKLIAWMTEAVVRSREGGSATMKDLLTGPSIFPFQLDHCSADQVVSL
jgi:hypothetical protein